MVYRLILRYPPPSPSKTGDVFLTNASWLSTPHDKEYSIKKLPSYIFFSCSRRKAYRAMTSGWQGRHTLVQKMRPGGSWFQNPRFRDKEKLGGGATVEQHSVPALTPLPCSLCRRCRCHSCFGHGSVGGGGRGTHLFRPFF